MTEWNNPTRITGLKGDTGKDTYAIALTTPGGTVFTDDGRGSISPSAITIIAKLSNLPDLTADNWTVEGATFYVTGNSITINYDDITSSMITVTATSGEYSASIGLTVVSQKAAIEYLGSLTSSVPTTSLKGEDIINGDFFLCSNSFTEDGAEYEVGQIYEYWYGNWQVSNNSSKIMEAMGDFIEIDKAVDPNVYSQIIAKQIVAKNIVAQDIYAQSGTIEGILKSLNYADDGNIPISGYQLNGIDSTIRAYDAIFGGDCVLYGKIVSDLLTTQEQVLGNTVNIPAFNRWNVIDAHNALSSVDESSINIVYGEKYLNTQSSFQDITATLNSVSISKVAKINTNRIIWSSSVFRGDAGTSNLSLTIPYTGTYKLYIKMDYVSSHNELSVYDNSRTYVSINLEQGFPQSTSSKTVMQSFEKGDVINIKLDVAYTNTDEYCSIQLVSSDDNNLELLDTSTNDLYELSSSEYYTESEKSLSVTSPNTFSSSNYINYVSGEDIVNRFSSFSSNINVFVSSSSLYYDTAHYTSIVKFIKTDSSVLFYYSSNEYIDIESGYGYKLSGAVVPNAKDEGLITGSLYPVVPANDNGDGNNIGSSEKKYRNVYTKSVNTGHGDNQVYPMDQGVRTTDSPTFANLNPPIDNSDTSLPSIGIGGFTFGYSGSRRSNVNFTLPSEGAYICIMNHYNSNDNDDTYILRLNGGRSTPTCRYIAIFRLS